MSEYDLSKLDSDDPDVKYGEQKKILHLSETNPEALYPDFDYFVQLLGNPNNIFKMIGIASINVSNQPNSRLLAAITATPAKKSNIFRLFILGKLLLHAKTMPSAKQITAQTILMCGEDSPSNGGLAKGVGYS